MSFLRFSTKNAKYFAKFSQMVSWFENEIMQWTRISLQVCMLLSGTNNIDSYTCSKWFCAIELYAIKRNMLLTGMRLNGVDSNLHGN